MKKISIFSLLCMLGLCMACNDGTTPQLGKSSVDKVVKAMTMEEKLHLLVGTGMAGFTGDAPVVGQTGEIVPGAAGTTFAIPRLNIPAIVVADGPAGLRISPTRNDDLQTYYCTAFPIATLLASTWNTELVEEVGRAMGNEVLEYGVDVILGPAMNINRNPLCGRNFEYYSEDPLISGKIAAAMVRGIQANGVGTSIKHFAANNQETNRMGNDARVSQRALHEIYLKGFEITVREAAPWTVMSSYNYINGVYASESPELLTDILRGKWGYKGTVMTDWFGGKNPPAQIHAGNELLMPGTPNQYEALLAAVNDGALSLADVDRSVKRMLNLILETPRFKGYAYSNRPDLKAHAAITRQSAAEGMVLLKNEQALPLPQQIRKIAAFGITSYDFVAGGTGSGDVNKAYNISLKEGLNNAGYLLNNELEALYETYIAAENEKNKPDPRDMLAMFMPKTRPAEMTFKPAVLQSITAASDIALLTLGRTSGEFMDRKLDNDYNLSDAEQQLLKDVCDAYHAAGKKVIVVLNIGGVIETASWKDWPDAILLAWQSGQEGGNAVADVIKGSVNPSGKLTMTFPVDYMDIASSANFPHDYVFDMGKAFGSFSGNQQATDTEPERNVDFTHYEEGIYVGYRHFDKAGVPVSYPFGYGLSYTSFTFNNVSVVSQRGSYVFDCKITNSGAVAGKEVVQLYITAPAKTLDKPVKELKAFAKTKLLQPGESQILQLTVKQEDLASYDEKSAQWVVEPGEYKALFGNASNNILQTITFN